MKKLTQNRKMEPKYIHKILEEGLSGAFLTLRETVLKKWL